MKTYIKDLSTHQDSVITLKGWLQNKRESKGLIFLVLRDGSGFCQCIIDLNNVGEDLFNQVSALGLESSVSLTGKVVADPRQIGGYEIHVDAVEIYQNCTDYPIANKEHGIEFLMDKRHLWLRSKRQWAIMRVRNTVSFAIHTFFQKEGFVQMDAPIFTGNACEGTTDLFETDFYGEPAYLSQSGQLYGESMAMAMGKIYTFGPTFRSEKSKTRRHLSEFWMIEPEMAFHDIFDNMDCIEDFVRFVVNEVLEKCKPELELLERDTTILAKTVEPFKRLTYDDAVAIIKGDKDVDGKTTLTVLEEDLTKTKSEIEALKTDIAEREALIAAGGMKKGKVNFNLSTIDKNKNQIKQLEEDERNIPQWLESAKSFTYGEDFGGSDETVLTRMFDVPVMVYDWPHEIKAFYLKRNPDNPRFARGVDMLAPEGYGEVVGGGERETNESLLIEKIKEHELPMEEFEWYLDLRRFGSVPHAGFGLGLERLIAWICKLPHVRETIPFPRMYGRLKP
ncbi:MAG: asparaginyl-tRNA synthetase [Bacteroidia bacterium]|jgi:asparaginyl-tRNA synthetase